MIGKILDADHEEFLAEERRCLTDLLTLLVRLKAKAEDEETLKNALEALDQLFLLVVVGEFNAGKSALINSLLGRKVLEEGVTPTTRRIHLIRHGEVHRRLEKPEFEVLSDPSELLEHLNIVDTPGTNAIFREHETLTREFIPRSDLVLFVTSADRPFTESERAFLEAIRDWGKKIVLVLNKVDLLEGREELDQVVRFVEENSRDLLGSRPEIFPVSAREAQKSERSEFNQFQLLEEYIHDTLDAKEKLRIKLSSPLGVGEHLIRKYRASLEQGLQVLGDDLASIESIEDQLESYEKTMREEFRFRLTDVDNLLHEFERRGHEFFDDRIRLVRIAELINKSKIKADYKERVIGDMPQQIEHRVDELIEWMVAGEFNQWQSMTDQLNRRRTPRSEELLGNLGGRFQYDRARLIESVGKTAQKTVQTYDREWESSRLAERVQGAVAGTALVEAGAIGLGTAVSLLATSTLADITGIVAASTMAVLGLFVIPARRKAAKKNLRVQIAELRSRLMKALNTQFDQELKRSVDRMKESIGPYVRFVRTEQERFDQSKEAMDSIRQRVGLLKAKLEDML